MAQEFPFNIRRLKGAIHEKIITEFKGQTGGLVQVGSEKWVISAPYADWADTIYNFEARPDDVFICSLPRSGTTWTQEMMWLICNNLDYEAASKVTQFERFPYLELHTLINKNKVDKDEGHPLSEEAANMAAVMKKKLSPKYDELAAQTTRRFIKTHLPMPLMPRNIKEIGAKVVYVARNPKDVAASYYHFHRENPVFEYSGDFETFLKYFMDDLVMYGPYWKHILDGWSHRDDENFHFMFYEDAKLDQENTLKKLANFLGHPLKDEDLPQLMNHLDVESFKKNDAINFKFPGSKQNFVRRGKVGGNPEITKEVSRKIDEWTKKNLANSELKFPFVE